MFFFSYGPTSTSAAIGHNGGDTGYLQSTTRTAPVRRPRHGQPGPAGYDLGRSHVNVTLNQTTINAQLPGQETAEFPGDRLLYNVYSDGSNPNIPVTNAPR